jgi:hypothetical protein
VISAAFCGLDSAAWISTSTWKLVRALEAGAQSIGEMVDSGDFDLRWGRSVLFDRIGERVVALGSGREVDLVDFVSLPRHKTL